MNKRDQQDAVRRYTAGETGRKIAEDLGVPINKMYRTLHALSVDIRPRGRPAGAVSGPQDPSRLHDLAQEPPGARGRITRLAKKWGVTRQAAWFFVHRHDPRQEQAQ